MRILAVAYASAIFAYVHICRIYAAKALFPNRKDEKTFVVYLRMKLQVSYRIAQAGLRRLDGVKWMAEYEVLCNQTKNQGCPHIERLMHLPH